MRGNRELTLTALLSFNFGLVFLDRNALNYMMPFVGEDLNLDNGQIGILAGATALSWAISGFLFSVLSDRLGMRRLVLVAATFIFSLMSIASGFATSFMALLLIRLVMGFAEGPVLPISQAVIAAETTAEHRGLFMGIMNNFGSNLLGVMIASPLLIAIAQSLGWRAGFWLAGLPGLVAAGFIFVALRGNEPAKPAARISGAPFHRRALARSRNLWLCMAIACCMLAWTLLGWAFLPLYLVKISGFTPATMSMLMATLGASAVVSSIFVPGLSDRIGRKPVLVCFALVGTIPPLAAAWSGLQPLSLAIVLFLGWMASGTLPLFMATIPSESVPPTQLATAMAIVMGTGEIIGGALMPVIAGAMADRHGLIAVILIQASCAGLAALLGLFISETAPSRRKHPLKGLLADAA